MSEFNTPYQKDSILAVVRSMFRAYAPARVRSDK